MQRWEYCTLWRQADAPERWYLTFYRDEGTVDRALRPDEAAGGRGLRQVWARTLARLGQAGWEMVAAGGGGFIFKRPVPSPPARRQQTAEMGSTEKLAPEP